MKKVLLSAVAMLFAGTMIAQSLVSTEPTNRNVIIEEYTGVGCGYCPDGHARANAICNQYADHAWSINIHQGGYAIGSGYETAWGDSLAGQYSISGYPCGTVNRGTMQNRGDWASSAASIRNQVSPVNIAAEASIDPSSRTLTVNVEMYYTDDQTSVSSNFLTVALLQNEVIGSQSNYGSPTPYNQEYVTADGLYRHMHMFRDMITPGAWGEEITGISTGTYVSRTYTYDIPLTIGAVNVDFENLEVIAFVSATHKNILTGTKAELTILPGAYMAGFSYVSQPCGLEFQPYVTVANSSEENVMSWEFDYEGNTVTVNKILAPGTVDTINMEPYIISVSGAPVQQCNATRTIRLAGITYEDSGYESISSTATASISFADFNIYTVAGPLTARIGIDHYGSEASVQLINQNNCSQEWKEGPWTNRPGNLQSLSDLKPARIYSVTFDPTAGLHILRLNDSYGDGWYMVNDNDEPAGVWLSNADGLIFSEEYGYYHNRLSFSERDFYLNVTSNGDGSESILGIDNVANVALDIYPNPVTDYLNINCADAITGVEVLDITGRTVMTATGNTVSTKALPAGVYMLRVVSANGVSAQKFVKE